MKKQLLYLVCVWTMVFVIYFIDKQMNYTDEEVLVQYLQKRNLPAVEKIIDKIDITSTRELIVYTDFDGYISTVLLDKGLLSFRVLNYFGSINPINEGQNVAYRSGEFYTRTLDDMKKAEEYLIWGIIYNPFVTDILYRNMDIVEHFNKEGIHLFYYSSDKYIDPNKLTFLDENDAIIE